MIKKSPVSIGLWDPFQMAFLNMAYSPCSWSCPNHLHPLGWSPRCGGIGLNLTAANHVIHFDRCYNPAKEAQVGRGWEVLGEGLKIENQRLEKRNIWVPLQAL